jgi:UDP-N-acetylglucosamine 4,6-dehydratase
MLDNKIIFITWWTGSWGNELTTQILERYNPKEIRIYSRGEHKQVEMKQKFGHNPNIKFIIGDVRDKNILWFAMKWTDVVFHLAALKHVPVCEENPWEAILTNVYGTQNVIECSLENNVKSVIDISTDKAVDPFNHYGCTKACGEKMIINANVNYQSDTKFVCIRWGNVIWTNGSVIPLFKKQILENNKITITDPLMTRYLMSTKEAIGLIFNALEHSVGWEVFVMRMPGTTVEVVADTMIELFWNTDTEKQIIWARPGEKNHEVLVSKNEMPFTKILNRAYFVILPQFADDTMKKKYSSFEESTMEEFNSHNADYLSQENLNSILKNEKWLWS